MNKVLKYNLPGIAWSIVIFILCTLPGKKFPTVPSFFLFLPIDKLVHFFLYFLFAFIFLWDFRRLDYFGRTFRYNASIVFLIGFVYGVIIEVLQLTIFTYRSAELEDGIANTLGLLSGILVFRFFQHRQLSR